MLIKYDWRLHEPGAWNQEYGGVDASVDFVLAPVRSWEDRLRIEMTYDMAGEMKWDEFIGLPSLIAQLAVVSVKGPPPTEYGKRDRYEGEYPYILLDAERVRRAIDWLREVFRIRLTNRCYRAAVEDGTWALNSLCSKVTHRFNFGERYSEWPRVEPGMSQEESLSLLTDAHKHELSYVFSTHGWNGWEEWGWLRFIGDVDLARKEHAEAARTRDAERAREEEEFYKHELEWRRREEQPIEVDQERGSYFAADYAEALRTAYAADHQRIKARGRFAFKALREKAKLTEAQERTVKRWLGYEGSADGFDGFIARLFAEAGTTPPK